MGTTPMKFARPQKWNAVMNNHYPQVDSIFAAILLLVVAMPLAAEEAPRSEKLDPWKHHLEMIRNAEPEFEFREETQFSTWQPELRKRLLDVLAVKHDANAELNTRIHKEQSTESYDSYRVVFQAEPGVDVPCFLLKPKGVEGPLPVMICLQGHKKKDGMLVSIGRVADNGGRDIALQAIRNGWAALAVEQRCFGERRGDCQRESLDALMLGKTLTGERVFDVMRAIDFIETQPDLDATRIGCMGNSTGGTVTFYAACVDPRIRLSVVSCSYCTYAESWLKIRHCACGYLPGIMQVADMGDLAGLIARRNLIIVAGKEDYLATMVGVRTAFDQTKKIFTVAECPENAELLVGDGGHQFYPDLAWPRIQHVLSSWATNE